MPLDHLVQVMDTSGGFLRDAPGARQDQLEHSTDEAVKVTAIVQNHVGGARP